jgi:hypothetical protein
MEEGVVLQYFARTLYARTLQLCDDCKYRLLYDDGTKNPWREITRKMYTVWYYSAEFAIARATVRGMIQSADLSRSGGYEVSL